MRTRPPAVRTLALALVAVPLLLLGAAGCGDDDSEETQTDAPSSTDGGDGDSSTSAPEDGGGDAGAAVPDRPAELVGEVTESEGDRWLVEEDPASPDAGRKAWVAIEGPVLLGGETADASAIEVGQRVQVWTGICAESYPEQCGAEAFVIEEG